MEKRHFELTEIRMLEGEENEPTRIEGYAALFDSYSQDLGGFREIIRHGAFADSIESDDVRALWAHDHSRVLGRTRNETLRLNEDAIGLRIVITPPETSWGRDALESIRRGDVDQMSFGFSVLPDGEQWHEDSTGRITRELTRVKLFEVSPVAFPAYSGTRAEARQIYGELPAIPELLSRARSDSVSDGESRARELRRRTIAVSTLGGSDSE